MEFTGRSLLCPICHQAFYVEVPVAPRLENYETDFRPIYRGVEPLGSDLHACPSCHYAGYPQAFGLDADEAWEREGLWSPLDPGRLPDEESREDLRRWIARGELDEEVGLEPGEEPHPAQRYLLAANCRDFLARQPALALFDLIVRAAWCARTAKESEQERELLAEAGSLLQEAIDRGEVAEDRLALLTYWVGELARRSGAHARAIDFFDRSEKLADDDADEALLSLLERQRLLATVQSTVPTLLPAEIAQGLERLGDLRFAGAEIERWGKD